MITLAELQVAYNDLLSWLATLTLGEIWSKIYNPPTRQNIVPVSALLLAACAYRLPEWSKKWEAWRVSRRVVWFAWPLPEQARPDWTGKVLDKPSLFSHRDDPSLLPPNTSKTRSKGEYLTCFDPAHNYHLETIPLRTATQVAEQIESAHQASRAWAKTTFAQRKMLLRSLKAWVLRDMEGIVQVACRDTGKTKVDAVFGEIFTTLSKIDWLMKHGEAALAPSRRPGNLLLAHKSSHVHYQPLGLVAALVSWNYSFHNIISPILAALFSGNAIVVKCSEQVAWSTRWFVGGIKACMRACDLDDRAVELVICLPDVAEIVTRNPLIRHITFIGSEPVGRKVAAAAAEIMVPTCIELGGKDPAFLLPSADVKEWSSHLMRGVFQSAGQNCIGIELVMCPRSHYQTLISVLQPRIAALRVGTDVGSLISYDRITRLTEICENAKTAGADILSGGQAFDGLSETEGSYFQPTLVGNVKMDMEIAQEELFAPVMSVVPYDDVDEAVEWLNTSRFGLGAGVYGNDRAECRRVAKKLQCGMVSINDFGVFYLNQAAPFGGVKASGHGRFGGEEGLRALCDPKVIIEDRVFSWVRTRIPKPVDYPLPADAVSWTFLRGLVSLAYAQSMLAKLRGLGDLISASMK